MAQRRQVRVSRSLEGGRERPARGFGEPEAGARLDEGHDRLKPVLQSSYVRTRVWKAVVRRFVIGPGVPGPIVRPSMSTTGITSAAVPVRKHSSAV